MFPHLETSGAIGELERREALAVAARARRAGEATPIGGRPTLLASGITHLRGAVRGLARHRVEARSPLAEAGTAPIAAVH